MENLEDYNLEVLSLLAQITVQYGVTELVLSVSIYAQPILSNPPPAPAPLAPPPNP